MSVAELLSGLRARDVSCRVEGDRLKLSGPKDAVTPELQAELARRKAEVLEYLRGASTGVRPAAPPLRRVDRGGPLPLSFAQERIWFLDRLDPGTAVFNLQSVLPLEGPFDPAGLARVLEAVVARHEILRTRFVEVDRHPVQEIAASMPLDFASVDLGHLAAESLAGEVARRKSAQARRAFDLAGGPPVRWLLLGLGHGRQELVVTQHHIVSDGWSTALLLEEVLATHHRARTGEPLALPEPALQYADFASAQRDWLRGPVLERLLGYWKQRLGGTLPVLDLPTDRPRPAVQSLAGSTYRFTLPRAAVDGLKALAQAHGATPFMALLAAFKILLARYTGQEDVIVGTADGSRSWAETERMLGVFVNTLALRTDLRGDPSFRELLERVRSVAMGAYAHQDLPFEKLVEEVRPERDLSRSPVFQVLFVIQNTPLEALARESSDVSVGETATSAYDLSLYVREDRKGVQAHFEYNTDLFDRETIARMATQLATLIEAVIAGPEIRMSHLPLASAGERRQIAEWNATAQHLPEVLVHRAFEAQAVQRPNATAITCGHETITYGNLNARADVIARHLASCGVRAGERVAVAVPRSIDMVAALFGILKVGAAYVPLDPDYPRDRLAHMLSDAAPVAVVTTADVRADLPASPGIVLDLAALGAPKESAAPLGIEVSPLDLAYVIYTSGSTGRPKGVEVPHGALSNFLGSMRREPGLGPEDTLVAVTTLSFDIAALELFLPLTTGAHVVLAPRDVAADGAALRSLLEQSRATLVQGTPATWRMLLQAGFEGSGRLRILCGGEAMSVDLSDALRPKCAELWNVYGPTETTVWSTAQRVDAGPISIGRPIANTQAYVLDAHGEPAPIGVWGELYIGGRGVARGYRGAPQLTAARFVPDPSSLERGARMYRTGDVARWRGDGVLECLGRLDSQVKIRGFRIEIGEVEHALSASAGVRQCAVAARAEASGESRLVAYVVLEPGARLDVRELRAQLKTTLPDYMIPSAFVGLEALPLTPNGKVDRRALPAPDVRAEVEGATSQPPRDPVEEAIAAIWCEVLGVAAVSVHDDFFELGGHSLLATQALARVRETLGVQLPVRRMFETPTVAGLAAAVAGSSTGGRHAPPPIRRRAESASAPLSFAQERLWFLDHFEAASAAYNICGALRLTGPLDAAALERSLAEIYRRHEALRTVFETIGGRPHARLLAADTFRLVRLDVGEHALAEREALLARLAAEESAQGFQLSRGPLFRATLVRLDDNDHALLATMHHIVSDGWSLGVIVRELGALYAAFREGRTSPLPELPVQYFDFAKWQREWLSGATLEEAIAYWKRTLAGVPVLDLPTDRPRPAAQTFRGAWRHFLIPEGVAAGVRRFARAEKATTFMTLLAAFQALLHRYTGQRDIAVGSPIAGRSRSELEPLIGLFANTLVLRTDLSGDPRFRELLARVREVALGAYAHQEVPFEKLVEELRPPRNLAVSPLFQVMLVLQNAPMGALELGEAAISSLPVETGASQFDLSLYVRDSSQGMLVSAEYNTDLFGEATVARMVGHLENLLQDAVARPEASLSELRLLSASEEATLLRGMNATAVDRPKERCVQELIEAQARRTPERIALVAGEEEWTYRRLNERANQLASKLRQLGVRPEDRVGLFLERQAEMLVAVLAVLKSGAAYVPLDPSYPKERLAYMAGDARISVLVTQDALFDDRPDTSATVVSLDADAAELGAQDTADLPLAIDGANLAYVIYTSGSTGRPKGVAIPHAALMNFLWSMREEPGLSEDDVLLSVTTLSFDIAGLELFLPLVVGGRVVLVPREVAVDGAELSRELSARGATVMQATPATWRLLAEAGPHPPIKRLCGGEALHAELAQALLADGGSLWNLYGPTETTVWSTVEAVRSPDGTVTLGHPIANTQLYVLDAEMRPVPFGVAGELYIGGAGVARGYWEQPALTATRFVPDPFGAVGGRLYRTGDVVRRRGDGALEFLGRRDGQIKIRGFRIELGEIEEALLSHPDVVTAAVVAAEAEPGDQQLVAYTVFGAGAEPTVTELRRYLKKRLPAHMVPASFVTLDALPLTPNGKVDRGALRRLGRGAGEEGGADTTPLTPTEGIVAEIWREALGISAVRRGDNFFDIGGHSLLSMRVIASIEKALGVRVNPREMIFQTLEQLAAMCDARLGAAGEPATMRRMETRV